MCIRDRDQVINDVIEDLMETYNWSEQYAKDKVFSGGLDVYKRQTLGSGVLGEKGGQLHPQGVAGENLNSLVHVQCSGGQGGNEAVGQGPVQGTKWWHRRFDPVGTHPETFRFRDGADVNGSVGPQEAIGLPKEPPCAHTVHDDVVSVHVVHIDLNRCV